MNTNLMRRKNQRLKKTILAVCRRCRDDGMNGRHICRDKNCIQGEMLHEIEDDEKHE